MFLYHVVYPSHSSNSVESHCVRTRSTMCTVSTMFITQNMRAMIRVISVLCMIAFIAVSFGYAQAQPTQTTQAPSKTKSKTQIESKSQAFDSPQVQSLWSNLHKKLTELGKRYAEHDSLPKNSLIPFKKDQKNNKKKINKITQKLLVELQVSQLDPLLKKRQKIHKNIEKLAGQIMKNKEKMIGAPQKGKLFTKSRQDYQDRITANQKQIQKYQQDLKDNLEAIYQQFLKMGIKINQRQVQDLFTVVSGETMQTFLIRFSNLRLLSDVIAYLIQSNQSTQGYATQAKRYYAIYVALVMMMIEVHQEAFDQIEKKHIPHVAAIQKKASAQIEKTKKLAQQIAVEDKKEAVLKNLVIQEKLVLASQNYQKYLRTQQKQIQNVLQGLQTQFKISMNTYQTIDIAGTLVQEIQKGVKDIRDLHALKLPQMIPISDDKLQNEFELVAGQLPNQQIKGWDKK